MLLFIDTISHWTIQSISAILYVVPFLWSFSGKTLWQMKVFIQCLVCEAGVQGFMWGICAVNLVLMFKHWPMCDRFEAGVQGFMWGICAVDLVLMFKLWPMCDRFEAGVQGFMWGICAVDLVLMFKLWPMCDRFEARNVFVCKLLMLDLMIAGWIVHLNYVYRWSSVWLGGGCFVPCGVVPVSSGFMRYSEGNRALQGCLAFLSKVCSLHMLEN